MALFVVEDWSVLLEETTGARSSIVSKTSDGRIVAQVHYASRLPRVLARQNYLRAILLRIAGITIENLSFAGPFFSNYDSHNENHGVFASKSCGLSTSYFRPRTVTYASRIRSAWD